MSLKAQIKAEIAAAGPMSVADYMMRCLHDPHGGYYATRPAIGETGDFITAPQVSQKFGELIGLWLFEVWTGLGAPPRVILAEAGEQRRCQDRRLHRFKVRRRAAALGPSRTPRP